MQAFINTHFDLELERGADLLAAPESLVAWLKAHRLADPGVAADECDLERMLALREGLRDLARVNGNGKGDGAIRRDERNRLRLPRGPLAAINRAVHGAGVEVELGPEGPRFLPAATGVAGAVGVLAALTAEAIVDGCWYQLKICPGHHCGWAFYDQSRNRAGRWCSMSVCGGRAKARAHYLRRRGD